MVAGTAEVVPRVCIAREGLEEQRMNSVVPGGFRRHPAILPGMQQDDTAKLVHLATVSISGRHGGRDEPTQRGRSEQWLIMMMLTGRLPPGPGASKSLVGNKMSSWLPTSSQECNLANRGQSFIASEAYGGDVSRSTLSNLCSV